VNSPCCNDTISKMRRDEHRAGGRRAPYVEEACAKLGKAAGRRHSQPARAPCRSLAMGRRRRIGRALSLWRNRPKHGEDAGAHARHMRRRTPGLCQLTFPPRSISRPNSASSPSLAAFHNFSALEGPNQPMCSARCQRRARVGQRVPCHAIGAKLSDPRVPKGAKHAMLREGASTQGPIPCSTRAASRPGSRVGRKGQRARQMRASANTSTPWRHSHVPLDPARAHSNGLHKSSPSSSSVMSTSIRPWACLRLVPLSDCLSDCPRQGARSQSVQSAIRSDSAAPRLYVIIQGCHRPAAAGKKPYLAEKVSTSHRRTSGRDRRG